MKTVPGKRTALLTASLILSACGGGGGGGTVPPAGTPVPTFTQWSNVKAGGTVQVDGLGQEVSGIMSDPVGGFTDVNLLSPVSTGYSAILTFDQARELSRLTLKSPSTLVSFDGATFTDLTLATGPSQFVGAGSPTTGNAAILANPIDLGWEYQSFGVWETASTDGRTFGAMSVGAPTAGTSIPVSATATAVTFTGYTAGSYVSADGTGSTALAELTVIANFGPARSLTFSTANTHTSLDWVTFTPNSDLNLSGTLTYAAGTNNFTGSVSSVGGLAGNSTGQFYGPSAEELGGVFLLQSSVTGSVETYAGAYGAKK